MAAGDAQHERLARAPGVLWRTTLRGVLINVEGNDEPFVCTSPGDQMWALLSEPRTRAELATLLAEQFDADAAQIEADLAPAIADLLATGALI